MKAVKRKAKAAAADKAAAEQPVVAPKGVAETVARMEQSAGKKGVVMALGDSAAYEKVESIPTGSVGLDMALGVGGLPRGRIIEIYGPEMSGKTTLALSVLAELHKRDKEAIVGFVDAEHALDRTYAESIGIDLDRILLNQPDCGEEGLKVVQAFVETKAVSIVVVDSVAALVPQAEIDGEMGDAHVGLHARLMSQALRKLTGIVSKSNCTVIFINQIREKIGVMFGSPETTTGGRALKFYASVRLDVRRIAGIKDDKTKRDIGNKVRVRCVKNKVAPPLREAEFDIIFGKGIDWAAELVDLARNNGILSTAGAWYVMDNNRMANGRPAMLELVKTDIGVREELRDRLKGVHSG